MFLGLKKIIVCLQIHSASLKDNVNYFANFCFHFLCGFLLDKYDLTKNNTFRFTVEDIFKTFILHFSTDRKSTQKNEVLLNRIKIIQRS